MICRLSLVAALVAAAFLPLQAQVAPPTFEVASVKKSAPATGGGRAIVAGSLKGDLWSARNATLLLLIQATYGPGFQLPGLIVGGPSWLNSERFDIDAKVPGMVTPDRVRLMAQALLAERFHLIVHREARELPVFVLVRAQSDGTLGPRMRRSEVDCLARDAAEARGDALPPVKAGTLPPCMTGMLMGPTTRLQVGAITSASLAATLAHSAGRPVIDRTGLSGYFTVDLEFAPERGVPPSGINAGTGTDSTVAPTSGAPSLYAAVQTQLGLKLEDRRERMDVLVIDRAERPTLD